MDFVTGLPKVRGGYDSIWIIVDRLSKSAHFIPVKTTYQAKELAKIYLKEIVKLHGAPNSIIRIEVLNSPLIIGSIFKELLALR